MTLGLRWHVVGVIVGPLVASAIGFSTVTVRAARGSSDDTTPAASATPLFRVFLSDGSNVVSYGEYARVADRVVFSMPVGPGDTPDLQLVDLPGARVDWRRTEAYADTVRAAQYAAARGEAEYAQLTAAVADTLDAVEHAPDDRTRLALVEGARRALTDWPGTHFNYRLDNVKQTVAVLDEALAELRVRAGVDAGTGAFDLSLVAIAVPPPSEPLLPAPSVQAQIEQAETLAHVVDQPEQRVSLLGAVLASIDRYGAHLPSAWMEAKRASVRALIQVEIAIDRAYAALSTQMMALASTRAKAADVRGVEQVLSRIREADRSLGGARPDTMAGLLAAVESDLDAARRLRLERDRWALQLPEMRAYRTAVGPLLGELRTLQSSLDDIKALRGSSPDAIGRLLRWAAQATRTASPLAPPPALAEVHALVLSTANLVESAAKIRREAALINSIDRAWNASSAAAGAMMLGARARTEMDAAFKIPAAPQ